MQLKFMKTSTAIVLLAISANIVSCPFQGNAQNAEMIQKLQEIKASQTANKQALAHYTWQEVQAISLKGEVKKTQTFQVVVSPDGQQQKTEIGASATPPPSGGKFKQRIVAKKKEEYQEYGEQMAALAKQYAHPDPELLQQAYEKGNISAQLGGASGTVSLVIRNYLKPGDSMTLAFSRQAKAIESLQVATYLSEPSDVMKLSVTFAKLPNGVNHVASVQVDGVAKKLGVNIQNSNYQPRM
jgi:hypothetical protein